MSTTTDRVLERANFFTGQKSGIPPQTLQPSDCETVKNFLTRRGTLQRAFGDSTYATVDGSGSITWMDRIDYKWIVQRGLNLFIESAEDSASFSSATSVSVSSPLSSDQYKREIYATNGTDQFVYNQDTGKRTLGLQPPISTNGRSTSGWATGTGGSLVKGNLYNVTFTFVDSVNNVESPAVDTRPDQYGLCTSLTPHYYAFTLDGSGIDNKTIIIDSATLQDIYNSQFNSSYLADRSKITHIRVYMSGASTVGLTLFRKVGDIAIADIGSTYTISSLATGVLIPDNNVPPPNKLHQQEAYAYTKAGSYQATYTVPDTVGSSLYTSMRFFRDSLFAVGAKGTQFPTGSTTDKKYDSIVYMHEPLQPDYVFDTRECGNGDGQQATAVAVLRDSVLVIFKERSIYYLSGTSVDNYVVRVMDTKRGAIATRTVQETPYGILALDRSGVIMVSAVGPAELISQDVDDVIRSINFSAISTAYSGYDSERNRYYLAVPIDSATSPNKTLVYNVEEKNWGVLEGQEGSAMNCAVSSTGAKRYMIGGHASGRISNISNETAVTVAGGSMDSEYLSGPFYSGDPTRKKKAKFVYITAESNEDWTIDIEVVPDFGQKESYILEDINSESIFSVYAATQADSGVNVGIFDESYFSAVKVRKQIKVPVYGIGYSFQVRIRNRSTDSDQYGFRILAIELETSIMGK